MEFIFFFFRISGVDITQENGGPSSQVKSLKGQSKQKTKKRHGYDSETYIYQFHPMQLTCMSLSELHSLTKFSPLCSWLDDNGTAGVTLLQWKFQDIGYS